MRRLIAALLVGLTVSAAPLLAQRAYLGFEQLTVADTAIGFTTAKIEPPGRVQAAFAVCRLETAQIRFTFDGSTPTSTVGTLWEIGEEREFNGHDVLVNFRAIRTGGTSGVLDCHYASQ